jgi:hypothetical protein
LKEPSDCAVAFFVSTTWTVFISCTMALHQEHITREFTSTLTSYITQTFLDNIFLRPSSVKSP